MMNNINDICNTKYSNIFYPGINWKEGDTRISQLQSSLEAKIANSYINTGILDGAIHVYLAWKRIKTQKNLLNVDDDFGTYNIAFANSGGTRTLVTKIETGIIKANYVVLSAPALIDQEELKRLVLNHGVKNIVIIQSKDDILNLLYITLEQNHEFYNRKIAPSGTVLIDNLPLNLMIHIPDKLLKIILNNPRFINNSITQFLMKKKYGLMAELSEVKKNHYVSLNITDLLEKCGQKPSVLATKETFWIGGSERINNFEFGNWSKNDDENYDIMVYEVSPNKNNNGKIIENPIYLHSRLRDIMVNMFVNETYPFDGSIESFRRK